MAVLPQDEIDRALAGDLSRWSQEGDAITVTSLLYGPEGTLLAEADKQTLMGHENVWFKPATQTSPVIETQGGHKPTHQTIRAVAPDPNRGPGGTRPRGGGRCDPGQRARRASSTPSGTRPVTSPP